MSDPQTPDPGAAAEQLAALAERSQRLVQAFWQRQAEAEGDGFSITDPSSVGRAFLALGTQLLADPSRLAEAQAQLWRDGLALWQSMLQRLRGEPAEPVVTPARDDRRFRDPDWNEKRLRLPQAVLPAERRLAEEDPARGRGARSRHRAQDRLLRPAVRSTRCRRPTSR